MNLLSLDQSSMKSGYSVFDLETGEYITSGVFAPPASKTLPHRLEYIRKKVISLVEEYNIGKVLLEDIQLQGRTATNVVTYKALAEVLGVISETVTELKIPFEKIHVASWRSDLNIQGTHRSEQKKNAQEYVKTHYNLDVSEDESDAICIGASYFQEKKSAFDWS